jgi:hypothetical protein
MLELVLLTGTIVASSFGFALLALILRNAVRKSRKPRKLPETRATALIANASASNSLRWDLAVRGYDTPELCREDMLAREGTLPGEDRF